MSTSDKLKKLMSDLSDELILEKEEEIKRLTAVNEKLREENDRLKQQAQFKTPDQFQSNNLNRKATELRKALDEFLGQEIPNRRLIPFVPSISIPNSSPDVNKSSITSENSKPYRSNPGDDTLMNGTIHNHHGIHNFQEPNHDSTFSTQQNFRQETDTDIVNAATEMRQPLFHNQQNHNAHNGHNGHNSYVPGLNNINGRRFNTNNIGGVNNNNNNRNRHNNIHNNNNINNINNNNSSSKYTIFIAWSGSSTLEQVRELFDPSELVDIRYTPPKQFAHVDLKTENAMNKAMLLNGTTKNEAQGSLRVETGKPRSSNPTENGQRQQNQTRPYNNRQNNNNKNPNGFNNGGLQQKKYNPNYNHNNRNNNNNHGGQYQNFGPAVEKENGTNGSTPTEWQNYATNPLNPVSNQEPKQNES